MTETTLPRLRLNEGDPSETRLYYLPHYVASALGYFRDAGIEVDFTRTASGGHTVRGGQIPAVLSGDADLTIGGPMVTMKMHEEGSGTLVNLCAAVRTHPWFLLSRTPLPAFRWSDLAGKTVLDIANIGTATLTFHALLDEQGLAGQVTVVPGSGSEDDNLAAFSRGEADFAIQQLHAAAPAIAAASVFVVKDLATATGGVPWSAYIALPDVVNAQCDRFENFARAIERSFSWIATHDGQQIAALVADRFPGYPVDAMTVAIDLYKAVGLWPMSGAIPQADFERFGVLLTEAGWLQAPAPFASLVRHF